MTKSKEEQAPLPHKPLMIGCFAIGTVVSLMVGLPSHGEKALLCIGPLTGLFLYLALSRDISLRRRLIASGSLVLAWASALWALTVIPPFEPGHAAEMEMGVHVVVAMAVLLVLAPFFCLSLGARLSRGPESGED